MEASMVHITPTINEATSKLFCDVDWWGDEVPSGQALDIAVEHEASDAHIDAEIADAALEEAVERASAQRGL
jgi:hypothetical protein